MSYKIAIVEDVHSIANMYKTKLQNMGYDTRVAYNGKQGLVLVEEIKPDLLLLDFMMPELDGAELLEIIRSKSWGKDCLLYTSFVRCLVYYLLNKRRIAY